MDTSNEGRHCALCGFSGNTHSHHVVGRIGPNKNNPENLIRLCPGCHHKWHNDRTPEMETRIYQIMKSRHGEKFPIHRNGRPIITKWIIRAMEQEDEG